MVVLVTGCELCTLHHLGGSHSLPSKLDHLLEEKGKDSLFLNIIIPGQTRTQTGRKQNDSRKGIKTKSVKEHGPLK